MTAILPDGIEYKNLTAACVDAASDATGVWGSEYPEEEGVRNLIVAVTGVRDEVGDIIVPGAFEHTLQRLEPKGCMGHDWNRVTGYPEAIEEVMPGDPRLPKTDRFGKPWPAEAGALFVRHRYHTDTEDGQRAYKDARFLGPRLACSIGYVDPKDDNGKPLYSYKKIDPVSGLMTRFLPRLDLFEYSQVLHGAHLMAGGFKDGKPKRLERKQRQRPDMELKIRLVRDSAYWGMPLGTPIRPGMKPQGPKARRLVAAGQQASESAGAVEVDANDLSIKPTAKGKQKGPAAIGDAYSGIMSLLDDEADPFDESFLTTDDQKINKGEDYNPLDILVANAIRPIEVEEQLRDNSDWDTDRLGDAAERQNEIDRYVADVVDAYREKYNAELVRQNDTGDSEVPEPAEGSAEDAEVQPEAAEDVPEAEPQGVRAGYLRAGDKFTNPDNGNVVTVETARPSTRPGEMIVQGTDSEGEVYDAVVKDDLVLPAAPAADTRPVNEIAEDDKYQRSVERFNAAQAATPSPEEARAQSEANRTAARRGELPLRRGEAAPTTSAIPEQAGPTRISAEDQAEIDRLKRDGRDNEAAKLYREAVQRARAAEGVTPEQASPTRARLRQQQVDGEAPAPSLEDGRTLQPVQPDRSETQAFELTGDNGATLRLYSLRRPTEPGKPWAYDIIGADGEVREGEGTYQSPSSALVRAESDFLEAEGGGAAPQGEAPPSAVEPVQAGAGAEPQATPGTPEKAVHNGDPVAIRAVDGDTANVYNTRTEQAYDAPVAELLTGGASVDEPAIVKLSAPQLEAADLAFGNDEPAEVSGAEFTPQGLAVVDIAEALATIDTRFEAFEDNPDQKRRHGRALQAVRAKIAKLAKPGEPIQPPAETVPANAIDVPEPSVEDAPEAPSGESTVEPGLAPDTVDEPFGETDPALADGTFPGVAPESEQTEEIAPDEIADTEEAVDASFGVTEAPDGEFEVDADIADRQDRVASLLVQSEAGSLDLSASSDDQLRGTRADIVDELRLQQHLERRRAGERAITRQQAERQAVDDLAPQEADDTTAPEETGPKPRPGVAGAAEDLADALDDGDQARIDAATERLRKSVNRSRSDSEVVAEIRTMLDGELDPAALRDAAERLRDEQRAKRNEGARRRRAARRFERERLRALLGQVEAEMRNRNLDYDPIPDENGAVTLDLGASAPVAWTSKTEREGWSGQNVREDELEGANYTARISAWGDKPPTYNWTVTDDNDTVLATGEGKATDFDSARASIEIALDTQRKLGLLPIDAQIPQGFVPEHTSATPLAEVVDAIQQMRQRVTDGRRLNPITGQPDPFGDTLPPLPVPDRSRFASVDQVRKYLESRGTTTRGAGGQVQNVVDTYRWDTAKLTPGAAFAVVDDLQGKPQVVHTVTGATFPPPPIGKTGLGRADLLRYATIAEVITDRDGRAVDWNQNARDLVNDINSRSFTVEGDGQAGLRMAALDRLAREKIRAGQFTHVLVQRDTASIDGVVNTSRHGYVNEQRRTLAQLINVARGKPDTFDKKTLDTARSAHTLAALGAPDVAAVLLTRRAAEIREQHPDAQDSRGAAVLDSLARGYLGMFSPMRSHGERIRSLKPGEQVFLSGDHEGDPPRGFRVLAAPRRDPRGGPSETLTPVIDEKTGEQKFLRTDTSGFRIEESEEIRYGYNPLSADLSGGRGAFVVVGPGEEPPATEEDLRARQFDDTSVIPQDVLDAAAEVLPESAGETAARRAAAPEGGRAPRRRSPAAPKRTAQPPAAPEPVQGEQHLAEAQGRTQGRFLGMPFEYGGAPERGAFDSVDAVREHLVTLTTDEQRRENPQRASSADAAVREIDAGESKLSPGGVFLVRKNGTVTHAPTGFSVWPPSASSARPILDDLHAGGYSYNQAAGLRVARALESGVFDGEQIDWSGDGKAAIKQTNAISARNGKFHPIQTAQRAAFLDGVLGTGKPRVTDVTMFAGMGNNQEFQAPNAEAFDRIRLADSVSGYEGAGGYAADSKAGAALAKRVATELRLAMPLARTAPLDAVRRFTRLADELDGQSVTMRSQGPAPYGVEKEPTLTLNPSEDLRAAAKMITDMYDPSKISESGRFRRAGMVGQVELTKSKITVGRTWEDPNGVAGREVEKQIRDAGGIRFYRDENGMLHATFAGVDVVEGTFPYSGSRVGAISLTEDGRLTVSYMSANRLIIVEAPPGSWKFTPEETGNGDAETDISGPEIESSQAGEGADGDTGVDVTKDMAEIERLATEDEE